MLFPTLNLLYSYVIIIIIVMVFVVVSATSSRNMSRIEFLMPALFLPLSSPFFL